MPGARFFFSSLATAGCYWLVVRATPLQALLVWFGVHSAGLVPANNGAKLSTEWIKNLPNQPIIAT
jgi:hypothetical protein